MAAWPILLNIHTSVYQRTKSEQDNQQKYLKYIHVLYHRILFFFFSAFLFYMLLYKLSVLLKVKLINNIQCCLLL